MWRRPGTQPQAADPSDLEVVLVAVFGVLELGDEAEDVEEDDSADVLPESDLLPESDVLPEPFAEPLLERLLLCASLRESLR